MEEKVYVQFAVTAWTIYTEEVHVVGSIPELGSWDVNKSVRLHTEKNMYPSWISDFVPISTNNIQFQYKFVKKLADKIVWEMGTNREFRCDSYKLVKSFVLKSDMFCHEIQEYYGRYGMKYISEKGKHTSINGVTYQDIKKPAILCPYHKHKSDLFQLLVSYQINNKIELINKATHIRTVFCFYDRFAKLSGSNTFYILKSLALIELKFDDKGEWKISKKATRRTCEFSFVATISNQAVYAINYETSEKYMIKTDKWHIICSPQLMQRKYTGEIVTIKERYIYMIADFEIIERLDAQDEEAGWKMIQVLPKELGITLFEKYPSEDSLLFIGKDNMVKVNVDADPANNIITYPFPAYIPKDDLKYKTRLWCPSHRVFFIHEPTSNSFGVNTIQGFDARRNVQTNLEEIILSNNHIGV